MAGDWIKMRVDLATCPQVVRISSALCIDRFSIVGRLHAVWSLFDAHSTDGKLAGYSLRIIDEVTATDGFGEAMVSVGWLEESPEYLAAPRFDEHNGQTAKRRAMDSRRKNSVRKRSAKCPHDKRTKSGPEKRREENIDNTPLPPFQKPSVSDVAAYCRERNNAVNPQQFIDHYEANGWRVGRNPMKDWRAAVRTWEKNYIGNGQPPKPRLEDVLKPFPDR